MGLIRRVEHRKNELSLAIGDGVKNFTAVVCRPLPILRLIRQGLGHNQNRMEAGFLRRFLVVGGITKYNPVRFLVGGHGIRLVKS